MILVTGGTGLLGKLLHELVENGIKCVLLEERLQNSIR